jgi:crossover junction endodeoxyribonuclease RuvC
VNEAELGKIMRAGLQKYRPLFVFVEQVSSMPKQGVSAVFTFGTSYGIVRGCLGALEIPFVLVTPQKWKRKAGLIGKEKDLCRTLMQQRYPQAELGRKRDIGRADAIAIGLFGH